MQLRTDGSGLMLNPTRGDELDMRLVRASLCVAPLPANVSLTTEGRPQRDARTSSQCHRNACFGVADSCYNGRVLMSIYLVERCPMLQRIMTATALLLSAASFCASQTPNQPELVSPFGAKFYSQPDDKNQIVEAEKKLAADPKNIELIIALGRAQATVWRFQDAIATFTRGIQIDPNNAMLYRHRGHRFISTRQFAKAVTDMERASRINDKNFDIWYHLALAHYLKGHFDKAAAAYEKAYAVSEKDDSRIAASDWLYMSYRRAGKTEKAT